jgi:hypothetical protein
MNQFKLIKKNYCIDISISDIEEFDKKAVEITNKYKIGEKREKGMIMTILLNSFLLYKREALRKQTQRARKIYEFFEKIRIDKIKYITTYSANSISELFDSQVQTIIDYFSKNPNTDDQDDSIIDSKEEISDD